MKEDKAHIIRKTFVVITLILIFATLGILLMSFQIKTVSLDFYGNKTNVRTVSSTVGDFLIQNKIYVTDDMKVTPSLDTKLENEIEIKIESTKEISKIDLYKMVESYEPTVAKIIIVVDTIPYSAEKLENAAVNRGTQNVVQQGEEGQKTTRYLVKYNGEEEIYRAELDSVVTLDPKNELIEVGTKLVTPSVARSAAMAMPSSISVDENFKAYNIKLPVEQQKFAYNMCQYYGLQYELFLAMMYKESGYNPNALGGGNSYGLCQIHISNHYKLMNLLGISNFYNPYDNIHAGAYMLSLYFGSARKMVSSERDQEVYALNSYNMGESAYFNICFSQGILDREYSTSIRTLRDRLIANGGL